MFCQGLGGRGSAEPVSVDMKGSLRDRTPGCLKTLHGGACMESDMVTKKKVEGKGEKSGKAPGFEKALARLEAIVSEMEAGALGLEEMIARFEEGQSLVKFCTGKLNEVDRKIEVLVKKGDTASAEPFGEDGGGAAEPVPGEEDGAPGARQGRGGGEAELF